MKTLVLHPFDVSTKFLENIYKDKGYTLINTKVSKSKMIQFIKDHDRIIMLGHGTEEGLIGFGQYIINSRYVYLLREKLCICIWCNADKFVEKYKLTSPLFTGMIISEIDEAYLYSVMTSIDQINKSNLMFSFAIMNVIENNPINLKDVKDYYFETYNPIICFNRNNIYSNIINE